VKFEMSTAGKGKAPASPSSGKSGFGPGRTSGIKARVRPGGIRLPDGKTISGRLASRTGSGGGTKAGSATTSSTRGAGGGGGSSAEKSDEVERDKGKSRLENLARKKPTHTDEPPVSRFAGRNTRSKYPSYVSFLRVVLQRRARLQGVAVRSHS
jgi:hypothetical protein